MLQEHNYGKQSQKCKSSIWQQEKYNTIWREGEKVYVAYMVH